MSESAEHLMSVGEVAELLGISVKTLYDWRYRRKGPPALKIGQQLRWRRQDLEVWLDHQADGC